MRCARLAVFFAMVFFGAFSCGDRQGYPEVEVDAGAGNLAAVTTSPSRVGALRFSVATMWSAQANFDTYAQLFAMVGRRLGMPIELVQRRTYHEVNTLILENRVDAALVCTGGYLWLKRQSKSDIEVLAVPQIAGEITYRSLVIVPASSPAVGLADLAGRRFAYTDPLSLTGRLYILGRLGELGLNPAHYFGNVLYSRSHDRSIEAVANQVVDGAAVDSLVYLAYLESSPEIASRVRVVDRSPPFGVPPVIAAPALSSHLRDRLRQALLDLHKDPAAAGALHGAHIDRFVQPPPDLYRSAEAIIAVRP